MRLPVPFIQLPFAFDTDRMREELRSLSDSDWMGHPSGMVGNSAVALVSHKGSDNDAFGGKMEETPHLAKLPYHRQIMANFNEVLSRSRLMRLAGNSEVSHHVDFNYHWYSRLRIHIPIVTNPNVIFHCGHEALHMQPGECWIFDSWRWHKVVNSSTADRIHLVIDLSGSSRFWRMVEEAHTNESDLISVPYKQNEPASIRLEKYNIAPVMAPGELEAIAHEIIRDFKDCPNNADEVISYYEALLLDLGRDWREIWYEYGQGPMGWSKYRELLDRTQNKLYPERRALVTSSNNVGVNPIIIQRLLRPALASEHFQDFIGD